MNDFLMLPNENMDVFVKIAKQGLQYSAYIIRREKLNTDEEMLLM